MEEINYFKKYLKYKIKYLELKNGGSNSCKPCNKLKEKDCKISSNCKKIKCKWLTNICVPSNYK